LIGEVLQTRRFARTYKKLKPEIVRHVDQAVEKIQADPEIGQQKKATLRDYVSINSMPRISCFCWATRLKNHPGLFICKLSGHTKISTREWNAKFLF